MGEKIESGDDAQNPEKPRYMNLKELVESMKAIEDLTPQEMAEFVREDVESQIELEKIVKKTREEIDKKEKEK